MNNETVVKTVVICPTKKYEMKRRSSRSCTLKLVYEFQKKLLMIPQVEEITFAISTSTLKYVKIIYTPKSTINPKIPIRAYFTS